MSSQKVNNLLSLIILILTFFGFAWLFSLANTQAVNESEIDASYATVDIDSIKKDVTDLLSERQNASGMPIPEPTSKMGKSNPFAGL